jgi:hypothetical protein
MTAEERANRFIDAANPGWRLVNPSAVAAFAGAMAREIRAAEAAAAARQREVVLALIRTSRASWDRCPDPDERSAVQAALDVLALAVRSAAGELLGPAAGGGGAGGAEQ